MSKGCGVQVNLSIQLDGMLLFFHLFLVFEAAPYFILSSVHPNKGGDIKCQCRVNPSIYQ